MGIQTLWRSRNFINNRIPHWSTAMQNQFDDILSAGHHFSYPFTYSQLRVISRSYVFSMSILYVEYYKTWRPSHSQHFIDNSIKVREIPRRMKAVRTTKNTALAWQIFCVPNDAIYVRICRLTFFK